MANFIEKTRDILAKKSTPITKESAKILAITGDVCSVEQRIAYFVNDINESIVAKARNSQFRYLVEVPEDLIPQIKDIENQFVERGFTIHTLSPNVPEAFVINWK